MQSLTSRQCSKFSCKRSDRTRCSASPTSTSSRTVIKDYGAFTVKGAVRVQNEDRWNVQIPPPSASASSPTPITACIGCYDGHGGEAVAEWCNTKLFALIQKGWAAGGRPARIIEEAYIAADKQLLVSSGFLGLGERGIGGSKCGSTAATVILYQELDGSSSLLAANVGDARTLLIKRTGEPLQLSVDHVPDSEEERLRIESTNPNPRMPLVRFAGGHLAYAYLKGSLQFEGRSSGNNDYSSGFGVTAEPYVEIMPLSGDEDMWLVVSSDGLYAEEERGGGGGLDNNGVAELCRSAAPTTKASELAEALAKTAIELGSTDDVTVVVMRLGPA
ncbi:MAG: hypothetical protein WDW36_009845 [Sanguina aurantia]